MNIYEAITKIMEEGYSISKSNRNSQQGFLYRGIDDVMNTFQPLMAKYHIFVVPTVLEQTRETRVTGKGNELIYSILRMRYTFYAEDGTSVFAEVIGEGMDSGDKASNKAMSVAMKYAMFQTFCIPTEEMSDPDAETPPPSHSAKTAIPPATDGALKCDCCGAYITACRGKDGKILKATDLVAISQKRYGKNLCCICMKNESGS